MDGATRIGVLGVTEPPPSVGELELCSSFDLRQIWRESESHFHG